MKKLLLLFGLLWIGTLAVAQSTSPPENWFNLDAQDDNVYGVSTEKAYKTLLKGKKARTVIVAVIDSGVEVDHEDLEGVMWVNPGEIPDNGIDDDKNGYIDDIHGWNFIGGKNGDVNDETLEATRLYVKYHKMFEGKERSGLSKKQKKLYDEYIKIKEEVTKGREKAEKSLKGIMERKDGLMSAIASVEKALADKAFNIENVKSIEITGDDAQLTMGKNVVLNILGSDDKISSAKEVKEFLEEQFKGAEDYYSSQARAHYNPDFDPRHLVGDNYNDPNERYYGNNHFEGPDAFHGTHVSGIIAAMRNNDKGMNGVADHVRIMTIRAVPNGDERDKDVANAIRYAVDNGAQIINMSFGKGYSWNKKIVDKAVKYAEKHDVLMVHAAGNSSLNTDEEDNFPNDRYIRSWFLSRKQAKNWLEIGALSWKKGEDMLATFSNYGKTNVDVFAPGVAIYSTVPDNGYGNASGTSMAAPVTAGVAALLRSYFPSLTAVQVKEIIMKSNVPVDQKVKKPGSDDLVPLRDLCVTGGIVNAYKAVQMAQRTKGKKKIKFDVPKT